MTARDSNSKIGLILTGGGARAAYQVGVLQAIAELRPREDGNPFPIICGTSAGAINAAALGLHAGNFRKGVSELVKVWRGLRVQDVYRVDPWGMAKSGARWLLAMMLGGLGRSNPTSLFDNDPLRQLLKARFAFDRLATSFARGDLHALAINATGYSSGQSVTFFDGAPEVAGWKRARRVGVQTDLNVEHLMASAAIPFIFPAVRINREFFGDGSMRQIAPISPALHLGADRILVVTVGRFAKESPPRQTTAAYPSMAQIAGHVLSSIFFDNLEVDLERLQRINRTVGIMPPDVREKNGITLRQVDALVMSPSEDLEPIAARHAKRLPRTVRFFLAGIGATRATGSNLLSYLLFDRSFCRALMRLGYRDTMARADELRAFLDGGETKASLRVAA